MDGATDAENADAGHTTGKEPSTASNFEELEDLAHGRMDDPEPASPKAAAIDGGQAHGEGPGQPAEGDRGHHLPGQPSGHVTSGDWLRFESAGRMDPVIMRGPARPEAGNTTGTATVKDRASTADATLPGSRDGSPSGRRALGATRAVAANAVTNDADLRRDAPEVRQTTDRFGRPHVLPVRDHVPGRMFPREGGPGRLAEHADGAAGRGAPRTEKSLLGVTGFPPPAAHADGVDQATHPEPPASTGGPAERRGGGRIAGLDRPLDVARMPRAEPWTAAAHGGVSPTSGNETADGTHPLNRETVTTANPASPGLMADSVGRPGATAGSLTSPLPQDAPTTWVSEGKERMTALGKGDDTGARAALNTRRPDSTMPQQPPERFLSQETHRGQREEDGLRHESTSVISRVKAETEFRPDTGRPVMQTGRFGSDGQTEPRLATPVGDFPAGRRGKYQDALPQPPTTPESKAAFLAPSAARQAEGRSQMDGAGKATGGPAIADPVLPDPGTAIAGWPTAVPRLKGTDRPGATASGGVFVESSVAIASSQRTPAFSMISASPLVQADRPMFEPPSDLVTPIHGEAQISMRPGALPSAAPAPNVSAQAVPPQVSQVSSAILSSTDASFDIHLSPAELGKVRISLTPSDAGILVTVLADRPETLDLLRRHADLLAQDFREIGYENAAFSFGAGGQDDAGGNRDAQQSARRDAPGESEGNDQAADVGRAVHQLTEAGRMDLRV